MRTIIVVPYNPDWPQMFRQEAEKLKAVFGEALVEIHHIGSTSVPGLAAKPIIDMMPLVRNIEQVDGFNPAMAALGYEAKGEHGIPGRRYFQKGGDEQRSHQAHVFAAGSPQVARHLAFRDFLRAHPDVAREYGRLKAAAAQKFPHDIEGYMAEKDSFIKETERKAQAWRQSQQ